LTRRGRVYTGRSAWTVRHKVWLGQQVWHQRADQLVFDEYRLAISQAEDRVHELDRRIEEISQTAPYQEPVGWLRCFRGIDTIIAMTILTEVNDFQRFQNPRSFMAFLGLVPSERSSASQVHRGRITKAGNLHARRILVESAWSSRHKPIVGYYLRKRREGQPAWVIAHADRAMRRLYVRQLRLRARGKPLNKTIIAVAREIAGFVWAVMHEGLQRRTRELTHQSADTAISSPMLATQAT
jgi:transposase